MNLRRRVLVRLFLEFVSLRNCVVPTPPNNYAKKLTLTALVVVWAAIELGAVFVGVPRPPSFWAIRSFVLYLVGRMHGVERERLNALMGGGSK